MIKNEKLLSELENYFKMSAFTWSHRKDLNDIMRMIPGLYNRDVLRKAIKQLRKNGLMIISSVRFKGYSLCDIENDLDRKMAKEFIQSQKSRIFNTWDSIKCFDVLFPEGQLTMEFSK